MSGLRPFAFCKQRCAYPPPPVRGTALYPRTGTQQHPPTRHHKHQKPCGVCDKIKGRCCFLDNKVRSAVCVLYIFVSELTLYVHAPANCGNTALAELTTSWQSCYRRRRRRRCRCCCCYFCCCCCCCCCCFRFRPQKRQTHLKPLIAASFTCATVLTSSVPRVSLCPNVGIYYWPRI